MKKIWGKIKESWDDFLFRQHSENAEAALEEMLSKEDYWTYLEETHRAASPEEEPAKREPEL